MTLLVACLLLLSTPVPSVGAAEGPSGPPPDSVVNEAAPIEIDGETGFAAAVSTHGWSGDGSKTDPYVIEVLDVTKPIAVAGPDVTVAPEEGLFLNGSLSTDDVGIVRAEWYITCDHGTSTWYGLVVGIRPHHEGIYDCTLKVWDAAGNSDEDSLVLTVVDLEPPVVLIDPGDQVVPQLTTLDISGANSTDNWIISSWNWTLTSPDDDTTYYDTITISHTFIEAGVHTVTLRVTDAAGLWNATSINVTVLDTTPPQSVPGMDLTIDQGETVHLNGTRSWDNVGIVNWTWTVVGPGVNATYHTPEANHTFPDAGVFTVTLRVEDAAGLNASASIEVTVLDAEAPVADAGADVTVDEGTTVYLDPSNSTDNVGIVLYVWNFTYDGRERTIPYNAEPYTFLFVIPGVYAITLTVTDARGNTATDQMVVTVRDTTPPKAGAGDNLEVDQHTEVTFSSPLSTDNVGIVNYTWTFEYDGEEQVLDGQGSTFTFDRPGEYNVTLTVADAAGNTASDTLVITVRDTTDPVAVAGEDVQVEAGTTVAFDGSSSWDNVGVTRMEWTFTYDGEDRSLTGTDPEFTFHLPGVYPVALVVSDEAGNTAHDTVVVTVVDTMAPVAVAGNDVSVLSGGTVELNGYASTDNVGIVSYRWTFTHDGEDRTVVGPAMSFTFEAPGEVVVTLTVEDASGNVATDTVVVTVRDTEPPRALAGDDVTVDQHTRVALDASGSTDNAGIATFSWHIAGGDVDTTLDGTITEFTFDAVGEYTVTLTVADAAGNSATDELTVTVLDADPPVADAGPNIQVKRDETITLDGSASSDNVGVVSWVWTIAGQGQELTREGETVTLTLVAFGDYNVTLEVSDARGNTARDTLVLTVVPPPVNGHGEPDEEGISMVLVGGIAAAVIVAVFVVVLLVLRRKPEE